ncbi:polysaccharide biosynthesis protein [Elioraea thermophila]|uniref:polysaccharide biosynthesis protein n=1 Tax=Elioraea thermophila TaxID=2185104 RepID=UPI000DF27FB5|nr:nucleoside-diphosphate sugar epimerase/dehydratase [Elioraea thermophila]
MAATDRLLSRFSRSRAVLAADALAAALSWPLALGLASPAGLAGRSWGETALEAWAFAALCAVAFLAARIPRVSWRYLGLGDLLRVIGTASLCAVLFGLVLGGVGHLAGFTPLLPVIHALVVSALLLGARGAWRAAADRHGDGEGATPVLLAGGGDGADLFLRAIAREAAPRYRVVGLVTDDPQQSGRLMHGVRVEGTVDDIAHALRKLARKGKSPKQIVVTGREIAGERLERLLDVAEAAGVSVAVMPRLTDLRPAARGEPARIELKPVAIEDLLDRPQRPLDREAMARLIQGRRVLVTGAGGTIGAELSRQIAALGPAELVLAENSEFALYAIDLELAETAPEVPRVAVIADIRDRERILALFARHRPELVFHAAALKHVPIVEANPGEGILTNALGTRIVADAARLYGAVAMVLISTDKAVNPTSVMGATKRLAEMYCQALDLKARADGQGTRFVTVRFGNVLGSTGSVVPLFRRQLERGGPLTVTHPDMQRYFMTVQEAVGLVLAATVVRVKDEAIPESARQGGIFVLDMGKPVKIVDLARRMIRLAGLRPEIDVEIRYTGLRPGEKLHEELFHGRERLIELGLPGLLMAAPRTVDLAIVARAIDEAATAARAGREAAALSVLAALVPEFAREGGEAVERTAPGG